MAGLSLLVVSVVGVTVGSWNSDAEADGAERMRVPVWSVPAMAALVVVAVSSIRRPPGTVWAELAPLTPALAFLAAGVPLAVLLDRLGFFPAAADAVARRDHPGAALWVVAACTTAVLNLDTTVVLLAPLYVRLARRLGRDPFVFGCVPLLLANLASTALPVSNLTTLLAAEIWHVPAHEVAANLGLPTVAACAVGWLAYRRAFPAIEDPTPAPASGPGAALDRRALVEGAVVVGVVLIGFVAGPLAGLQPWMVVLAADVVLMARTRHVPVAAVPLDSLVLVGALAVVTSFAVPGGLGGLIGGDGPAAALTGVVGGAVTANATNNLPALLAGLHGGPGPTSGGWGWVFGVSVGPVLWPIGSLANLLWWRSMTEQGVPVAARDMVRVGVRVGLPALAAGTAVFVVSAIRAGGG